MKCGNCGNEVGETAEKCPHCGAVFTATRSETSGSGLEEGYLRNIISAMGVFGVLSPLIVYFVSMPPMGRADVHVPLMVLFIGLWGGAAVVALLEVDGYLLFSAAVFGLVGGMSWFWIVIGQFGIQLESALFYQIWLYEPVGQIIAWNLPAGRWRAISSIVNPLLGIGYLGLTVLCLTAASGD